jgi:hypothetical protein
VLGSARPVVDRQSAAGWGSAVELVVAAFVLLGYLAILVRFAPRRASERVGLPEILDESVAMWLLRRLTRRGSPEPRIGESADRRGADGRDQAGPTWPEPEHPMFASPAPTRPPDLLAARRPAPASIVPTRVVVAGSRPGTVAGSRARESTQPRSMGAAIEGRLVAVGSAFVFAAIVLVGIGAILAPSPPQGGVLGATGHPALATPSASSGAAEPSHGTPSPKASIRPASARPSAVP